MMKDLLINFHFVVFILISFTAFTQELIVKTLDKNIKRMVIENHYYPGTVMNIYSIIFVYCNGGYYNLYDTSLDYRIIGYQRYFCDTNINITGKRISTELSDNKLPIDEFVSRYLVKVDNEECYNVNEIINRDIFYNIEKINSILFAAQHNYDFLILGENGNINLYLPENYLKWETLCTH